MAYHAPLHSVSSRRSFDQPVAAAAAQGAANLPPVLMEISAAKTGNFAGFDQKSGDLSILGMDMDGTSIHKWEM